MKRTLLNACYLTPIAAALLFLNGCGGGSGTTDTATTIQTYELSGTVPGTLIEAFCNDGSYHSTNSNNNGSPEHPFSLSLPAGVACELVMTMNENDPINKVVVPLKFSDGSIEAIALSGKSANTQVNIGFVDLPHSPTQIDDNDGDHVKDTPLVHPIDNPNVLASLELLTTKLAIDPDADGIPNYFDPDDDNDGIRDTEDTDDDNDGVLDIDERDRDLDGVDDIHDRDDDNDGIYDEHETDETIRTQAPITFTLPTSYAPDPTGSRLLASQCAQCHGTNGYSVSSIESLAGEAGEIPQEFAEYHARLVNDDIMTAQAKAYTTQEAQKIANYFQSFAVRGGEGGEDFTQEAEITEHTEIDND